MNAERLCNNQRNNGNLFVPKNASSLFPSGPITWLWRVELSAEFLSTKLMQKILKIIVICSILSGHDCIKTDHPHCSPNPNGILNTTSEKIKTLEPWEYIHQHFQTGIQYTMKMNTTNLTQGNWSKLKEYDTEGKKSGQKERAKKRARARARAKPQTVIYPFPFLAIFCHLNFFFQLHQNILYKHSQVFESSNVFSFQKYGFWKRWSYFR